HSRQRTTLQRARAGQPDGSDDVHPTSVTLPAGTVKRSLVVAEEPPTTSLTQRWSSATYVSWAGHAVLRWCVPAWLVLASADRMPAQSGDREAGDRSGQDDAR